MGGQNARDSKHSGADRAGRSFAGPGFERLRAESACVARMQGIPSTLGADMVAGNVQDEGLGAVVRGQYGCPECKEFQALWGRAGWLATRKAP